MASPFPRADAELDYPLYAVDFDPQHADRLVVAGGGGAGRSGVGNKITVLETAQNELRVSGEIDLSRDEDSVMSLAVGASKGKTTYLYAGVNSGPDDIAKGKNEHFRTLAIEQLKARSSVGAKVQDAKVSEVSRASLFTDVSADTYQRVLRVAGSMGVAAAALGKEPQLAVFDVAGSKPTVRGVLEVEHEVEGLDVVQKGEGEFQVAYTSKHELYLLDIGKEASDPQLVFIMPENEKNRPQFKAIRYLTPDFILAIANLKDKKGCIIQGFRLPTSVNERARLAVTERIPRPVPATSLAVANISPPATPWAPAGNTQFAIAVAGHDSSLSLYTLEHKSLSQINILCNLYPLCTLKDVHGGANISGLAFSPFITPKTHIRPQFIKLASISLQKTIAVHSIALKKFVDKTPRVKNAPPKPVRYVVEMRSKAPSRRPVIIALSVIVLIMALVGQSIMAMYGGDPMLKIHGFLPSWHGTLRSPDAQPLAFLEEEFMSKLAGAKQPEAGETLVMWEAEHPPTTANGDGNGQEGGEQGAKQIKVDVHDSSVHGPGKKWDELPEAQQEAWKDRLYDAGAWTQGMGESVFKGILFGELAGAVGRAVGG